jgi:putative spermidine/putrescine transport system substrate-binding protein
MVRRRAAAGAEVVHVRGSGVTVVLRVAVVALVVAGLLAAGGPAGAAGSNVLTVTVFGGTFEKWERSVVFTAFEKETGATINAVTGLTMTNLAKLRASRGNPQIDIVGMDPPGAVPAANEGLLEKLDPAKIPNLNNLYSWAKSGNAALAPSFVAYQCLAYNTKMVSPPPTSWADLAKPQYKGKVILPDINQSHAYYLIMMESKLATGSDLYNADAAFKPLVALKPDVLTYWTSHDQVAQLLNSGQAWLAPWTIDRAITQLSQGAPIDCVTPKEGAVVFISNMTIAKGTKHLDLAEKFMNIWLSAAIQQSMATHIFLAPVNKNVTLTGLSKKYLSPKPNSVAPDWPKLMTLEPAWADRWNRAMVK